MTTAGRTAATVAATDLLVVIAVREQLDGIVPACSVQAWTDAYDLVRVLEEEEATAGASAAPSSPLQQLVQTNNTYLVDSGTTNDLDFAVAGIASIRQQFRHGQSTRTTSSTTPHAAIVSLTTEEAIAIMTIGTDSRLALDRYINSMKHNDYDEHKVGE